PENGARLAAVTRTSSRAPSRSDALAITRSAQSKGALVAFCSTAAPRPRSEGTGNCWDPPPERRPLRRSAYARALADQADAFGRTRISKVTSARGATAASVATTVERASPSNELRI